MTVAMEGRIRFCVNSSDQERKRLLKDANWVGHFSVHRAQEFLVHCAAVFIGDFPVDCVGNFRFDRAGWEPVVLDAGRGAMEKEMCTRRCTIPRRNRMLDDSFLRTGDWTWSMASNCGIAVCD